LIRIAFQEGIIPYHDLVQELAEGYLSPEDFLKTFSEGSFPAEPCWVGIRNAKLPLMLMVEAVQDALRNGKLPFEPYLESMQEGDFPLVNAATGQLLIQKPLYLNRTQQTVPTIIESDYRLGHVIGEGGSSQVYLGVENDTKREVAIKVVTVARSREAPKDLDGVRRGNLGRPPSPSPPAS
jgi:hypothetical protein